MAGAQIARGLGERPIEILEPRPHHGADEGEREDQEARQHHEGREPEKARRHQQPCGEGGDMV